MGRRVEPYVCQRLRVCVCLWCAFARGGEVGRNEGVEQGDERANREEQLP